MTTETSTTESTQQPTTTATPESTSYTSMLSGETTTTQDAQDTQTSTSSETTEHKDDVSNITEDSQRPTWLPEKFKTPEALLESYQNLEGKLGAFTGAPEEYELKAPEGVDFTFYEDGEYTATQFKEMAKEMGINQEAFSKISDFYIQSRMQDALMEQQARENAVFEVFGGQKEANKAIPQISNRVRSVLGDEGIAIYQDAASGSPTAAANAIKLAGMLINKLDGEHNQSYSSAPVQQHTREDLQNMMRDPQYKTSPQYRDKVDDLYRKMFD